MAPSGGDHEEPWFVARHARCRLCYRCGLDRLHGVAARWVDHAGCRAIQFTKSPAGTCGGPRSKLSRKRQPCAHVRSCDEYRAKHGLKPVQLDDAVTREAQYWSDQLNRQSACWFLYHDYNYHARMRARFPGRRFRENAACSGSTGGGAGFILRKWIDSSGHRENMLTPEWKTIGVGVTRNIWVIDFTN